MGEFGMKLKEFWVGQTVRLKYDHSLTATVERVDSERRAVLLTDCVARPDHSFRRIFLDDLEPVPESEEWETWKVGDVLRKGEEFAVIVGTRQFADDVMLFLGTYSKANYAYELYLIGWRRELSHD